jgi:hypothetical protein
MFKKSTAAAILIISFLLTANAKAEWSHKGAHLDLWCQNTSELDVILSEMAERGVNHVALGIWWFQDNINSTVVYSGKTNIESANDVTVRTAIRKAHDRGIKVMIKLIVAPKDVSNHVSCADIEGSDAWFNGPNGYGDYVRHFAQMAQQENVELMRLGTELKKTHDKEANWRSLIASVRAIYSGELTYSQNCDQNLFIFSSIHWWDALDYIGTEAYYVVPQRNPTAEQMHTAWNTWIASVKAARNAIDPTKKVIFTEGGCLSMDGAASGDQYSKLIPIDEQEQADWYKGMFEACWDGNEDWLLGSYFYDWQMHSYYIDPWGWEIQGKLAYDILSSYYTSGADRNGDGLINFKDLALLAAN